MQFLVMGSDGKNYGPVDRITLANWISEARVMPDATVTEFETGRTMLARDAIQDAPPVAQPAGPASPYAQPPSPYARPGGEYGFALQKPSNTPFIVSLVDSGLALLFYFGLHGIGLIFSVFAFINVYRCFESGHKLRFLALGIAIVSTILILLGYALKWR